MSSEPPSCCECLGPVLPLARSQKSGSCWNIIPNLKLPVFEERCAQCLPMAVPNSKKRHLFTSQGIQRPVSDLLELPKALASLPSRYHDAIFIFLLDELVTKFEFLLNVVKTLTRGEAEQILQRKALAPFVRIDKVLRDVVVKRTSAKRKKIVDAPETPTKAKRRIVLEEEC